MIDIFNPLAAIPIIMLFLAVAIGAYAISQECKNPEKSQKSWNILKGILLLLALSEVYFIADM